MWFVCILIVILNGNYKWISRSDDYFVGKYNFRVVYS